MSDGVKIELTEQAQSVIARLKRMPAALAPAIARGMDKANQLAIARIQSAHLTGRGPFPPPQQRLGIVTGRLRASVNASPAQVNSDTITSAIGSNVIYAAIHEFGGRIHHPARRAKVRLRTDARGNLVRQLANSNLATFASSAHKRAKEIETDVPAYDVEMPERMPFRAGIRESAGAYKAMISAQIIQAWRAAR